MTPEKMEKLLLENITPIIKHVAQISQHGQSDVQKYLDEAEERFHLSTEDHDLKLAKMMTETVASIWAGKILAEQTEVEEDV